MTSRPDLAGLLPSLIDLSVRAGAAILDVYESGDLETERKADASPLTLADRRSHDLIDAGLRSLTPGVPVLSEEGRDMPWSERRAWSELWLVDPLDGTKEFIKGNGEFTVNIAFIRGNAPVLGVIYAPVRRVAWFGLTGANGDPGLARRMSAEALSDLQADAVPRGEPQRPGVAPQSLGGPISVRERDDRRLTVIASRTHLNEPTKAFISRVGAPYNDVRTINVGSSLKLCYLAEGRADLYPRYAPTSEWDTAAGHAIIRAAGGEIYRADPATGRTDEPLAYNKENLLNPSFVACAW